VTLLQTSRPKKIIDLEFLANVLNNSWQIKLRELADILGVHRNTLCFYMKHHSVERKYSELTNADLDVLVSKFKKKRPDSGIWYIIGFLCRHGICVQHHWVVQSLRQVDWLGQVLQDRWIKRWQKYYVKRPNALWHMDGHHKLIWWGIIIHGFIDGFCRMVCVLCIWKKQFIHAVSFSIR